jgi:predicted nucleic acid-binding protein
MLYLLDTNTIIYYLSNSLPGKAMQTINDIVNEGFYISVITRIESLGFASGDKNVDDNTTAFINLATVFEVSPSIADIAIDLKRIRKIKTPDGIIAATALSHNLTLISRNGSDFNWIEGLAVVDPFSL